MGASVLRASVRAVHAMWRSRTPRSSTQMRNAFDQFDLPRMYPCQTSGSRQPDINSRRSPSPSPIRSHSLSGMSAMSLEQHDASLLLRNVDSVNWRVGHKKCFTGTSFQPLRKTIVFRVTQWIVSVNYLFGRPLIPSDFLKRIVTSNFRDMRNLMSVVFGLLKMSFWVPKKGQLSFSERR